MEPIAAVGAQAREPVPPVAADLGAGIADAYAVQEANTRRLSGRKIGLTAPSTPARSGAARRSTIHDPWHYPRLRRLSQF